jgi:hypothetical protein
VHLSQGFFFIRQKFTRHYAWFFFCGTKETRRLHYSKFVEYQVVCIPDSYLDPQHLFFYTLGVLYWTTMMIYPTVAPTNENINERFKSNKLQTFKSNVWQKVNWRNLSNRSWIPKSETNHTNQDFMLSFNTLFMK